MKDTMPYKPGKICLYVGIIVLVAGLWDLVTNFQMTAFELFLALSGVELLSTYQGQRHGCYWRRAFPRSWWGNLNLAAQAASVTVVIYMLAASQPNAYIALLMAFISVAGTLTLPTQLKHDRLAHPDAGCTCEFEYTSREQYEDYHHMSAPAYKDLAKDKVISNG